MRSFIALILTASIVYAENTYTWDTYYYGELPSVVIVSDPEVEDAIATVTFMNEPIHEVSKETFTLSFNGLNYIFQFRMNIEGSTDDSLTVKPPDGYVAIPQTVITAESSISKIHIFPHFGY